MMKLFRSSTFVIERMSIACFKNKCVNFSQYGGNAFAIDTGATQYQLDQIQQELQKKVGFISLCVSSHLV